MSSSITYRFFEARSALLSSMVSKFGGTLVPEVCERRPAHGCLRWGHCSFSYPYLLPLCVMRAAQAVYRRAVECTRNVDDIIAPRLRASERACLPLQIFFREQRLSFPQPRKRYVRNTTFLTPFMIIPLNIQFAVIINEHGTHAPPNDPDSDS